MSKTKWDMESIQLKRKQSSHCLGPALSLSLIGQDSFLTDLITNICGTIDKLH